VEQKALVMEVNEKNMILLTKDGQFVSRRLSGICPQIGEEISIEENRPKRSFWFSISVLTAAAVLFVVIYAGKLWNQGILMPMGNTVVTYVTVDINPSVELGLNSDQVVVSVEPLNEDGKIIIKDQELVGKSSDDAVEIIVRAAADKGYLAPEKGNQVIINVSEKNPVPDKKEQLETTLPERAEKVLTEKNLKAKVNVIKTDFDLYQEAKKLEISASKYAVLLEAKEAGLDITIESIKKSGLINAIKNAGGNPQEIIEKARQEKEFSMKIKKWDQELAKKNETRPEKQMGTEKNGILFKKENKQEERNKNQGRDQREKFNKGNSQGISVQKNSYSDPERLIHDKSNMKETKENDKKSGAGNQEKTREKFTRPDGKFRDNPYEKRNQKINQGRNEGMKGNIIENKKKKLKQKQFQKNVFNI